jgi:hypothetical protein
MPLWGKNDAASNSTIYAPAQMKQAPNTANRDLLFGNTTANAYFDGVTVGQYAVDSNEIAAGGGKVAHTGWVLRTVGQGGRAGRVMTEVLVAGGITGDASDDTPFPDYTLTITTNPLANSGSISGNITRTFTVAAASTPSGASLSYLWYYSTDNVTFNTTAAVSGFSNQTTATLSANVATLGANVWVKAVVSATGAASVNSTAAKFTATA